MEWKDVFIEAMKGAVILALLERFYVTRANSWFEDHIGACAACTTQCRCRRLTFYAQIIIACRASCSTTQQ